jgi:hypothetical protein
MAARKRPSKRAPPRPRPRRRTVRRRSSGMSMKPLYQIAMVGGMALIAAGTVRAVGNILH